MALGKKSRTALTIFMVLIFVGAWQGYYYLSHHAYSIGERTGVIRKLSIKGPPYCKYFAGEMSLQGTLPGQPIETWEFTLDHPTDDNPIVLGLRQAEKEGSRITLRYRQDRKVWWRCTPIEYYLTGIDK